MSCFQVRTDLALEARESITDADGELRGVRVEEFHNPKSEVQITRVIIDTKMEQRPWENRWAPMSRWKRRR